MKANELMIGDWVMTPYGPRQVDIIYGNGNVSAGLIELDSCELDGIPLTPEILEKNGFVSTHDGTGKFNYSKKEGGIIKYDFSIYVRYDITNTFFRFTSDWIKGLPIDFVHKLQHALRLCGIEKEIDL